MAGAAGDAGREGFREVGRETEFPVGRGRVVTVEGVRVAVFRTGDDWHALADACPHMGASLGDGKIEDGCVVCHWHHWKFDLRTGQGDQRSWARAAVYEVRVRDGRVFLGPPPSAPAAEEIRAEGGDDDWIAWDPDRFFRKKKG